MVETSETPEEPIAELPPGQPAEVVVTPPANALQKERPPEKITVFISYAREDREFAQKLAHDLDAAGIPAWIDTKLQAGARYVNDIQKAILASSQCIVIRSPAAESSVWVEKEVEFAAAEKKRIVPVLLRECDPNLQFAGVQYVDFTSSRDGLADLILALRDPSANNTLDENSQKHGTGTANAVVVELPETSKSHWWRGVLEFVSTRGRLLRVLLVLALVIGLAFFLSYWNRPSETSLTVLEPGDFSAVSVFARNRGGKPSTLVGGFRLKFGGLPVRDDTLEFPDVQTKSVIRAHDGVTIRLTKKLGFEPIVRPDGSYLVAAQIEKLMPGKYVTLEIGVQESDDPAPGRPFHTRSTTFPVESIQKFVVNGLPTVPPTVPPAVPWRSP